MTDAPLLGLRSAIEPVTDVGGGIRTAVVKDPFGNLVAIIENPNFRGGS